MAWNGMGGVGSVRPTKLGVLLSGVEMIASAQRLCEYHLHPKQVPLEFNEVPGGRALGVLPRSRSLENFVLGASALVLAKADDSSTAWQSLGSVNA